jgi:hypothetical protein
MGYHTLGQTHFEQVRNWTDNDNRNIILDLSNQKAFLSLRDPNTGYSRVSNAVLHRYSINGLRDAERVQRVVRVETIKAGTRIYKLTGGLETDESGRGAIDNREIAARLMKSKVLFAHQTMSPWWAPVTSFEEDTGGIRVHFENMVLNSTAVKGVGTLTLREYARFMSAVVLEWNRLTYYLEVTLAKDVKAYWGQFEEQVATAKLEEFKVSADGTLKIEQVGDDYFVSYPGEGSNRYYLPAEENSMLGGMEAWQFYIPKFERTDIVEDSVLVIPSVNSKALAAHFGCPQIFEQARQMAAAYLRQQEANLRRSKW